MPGLFFKKGKKRQFMLALQLVLVTLYEKFTINIEQDK